MKQENKKANILRPIVEATTSAPSNKKGSKLSLDLKTVSI